MEEGKVTLFLNGREVEAQKEERLINVIRRHGIAVPSPCYHRALTEIGHCGLCLIGARRKSTDNFTVVFACTATAKQGMEIDTEFPPAASHRSELITLYLMRHPLDCAKCDKVGNCFLYRFSTQTDFRGFTRITNNKLSEDNFKSFGTNILHDNVKCIDCRRCIRFCRDILDEDVIGHIRNERGHKEIQTYPQKTLGGNYSLNLVDLCPAGAFIDKNCLHQPLEWRLMRTPSIATESSVGINTYVLHSKKRIFRIKARRNEFVNDDWITNSARREHERFQKAMRLTETYHRKKAMRLETALATAIQIIMNTKGLAVVLSGDMSLEDQFALSNLLKALTSSVYFLQKSQLGDGFLMSDDPTPNFNGAVLTGLADEANLVPDLTTLNEQILKNQHKCVLAIKEDIFAHGVSYALPEDANIIFIGTESNKTSKRATIAIPTATVFESTGTFINKDWRLQKFHKAVDSPKKHILPMWHIFTLLLSIYYSSAENNSLRLDQLWRDMGYSIENLKGIDFENLDSKGVLLKKR